ncbi:ADP-ribosylglycohydrolase-domain-containing protein [Aspergillus pseudodeflectus]|uniref:ADP-ribosylglycohydrolase-domain-containing protein n=1 Tax=Aspergillus pseudodeflectus TaxID=176178 RepID=A0ABR4JG58_9EURO
MDTDAVITFFDTHPVSRETVHDRLRGTIFGGALGDAIGLYTEFLSKDLARQAYPEGKFQLVDPVTEFEADQHRLKFVQTGWTDDTDHALLILLSYLHHNGRLDPVDFAHRLQFWVEQGLRCLDRLPLGLGRTVGQVVCDKNFLNDPAETAYRKWDKAKRNAAANGSLMRTYPLGVMCFDKSLEETFRIAREFSLVTHADPRCIVSCCLVTALIRGILREEVVIESHIDKLIEESLTWTESWISEQNSLESSDRYTPIDRDEFRKHAFAQSLEDLQLDDAMKMGYVYKTLGSSILLLRLGMRRSKSSNLPALFEDLITDLIMQGGDADTNAAVAGSLLGTLVGYNKLPEKWRDGVMHGGWLLEKCDALASVTGIDPPSEPYNGTNDPGTGLEGGKPRLTLPELHQREREFSERWLRASSEALEKRAREKGKIDQARKDRPGSRLRRFLFGK